VIVLSGVVLALALSLFGVFTLSPPQFILSMGSGARQEGHLGAFCMGLLATILGTACMAPIVGNAVFWAIRQPPAMGMLIFVFVGLGMALPYVILSAKPAWIKFIPRPGPWMETFEHFMGFVLLGTVAYLLASVARGLGATGLLWTVVFLLFVAAAMWCYGRVGFGARAGRQVVYYSAAVLLLVGGWWWCFRYENSIPELMTAQQALIRGQGVQITTDWPDPDKIPWVPFTHERVQDLVKSGKTVFIDYTAAWCPNCKTNESFVINTPPIRAAMRQMGVVPVVADFTLKDPEIKQDLDRYGNGAVPMTMIIPANRPDERIVLGVLLTRQEVLDALQKAGPSTAAQASAAGE
jgi:thiol:disulfide interchange protein